MSPIARRERLILVALTVGAIALRIAYILSQRSDLLFDYPVIDEERYVSNARNLAAGLAVEPGPWFQPPGLVYVLAGIFKVAGPGLLVPRLVQAVVSGACCWLVHDLARRWFDQRIAFGAATICALHGLIVFESYELLPPTWIMAASLLAMWLLALAAERKTEGSAALAGLALGVASVFGPVVLPFAAVGALSLRKASLIVAFVIGIASPILPVAYRNYRHGGEVVFVSTNAGLNFFIGNNEHYHATLGTRPGPQWDAMMRRPARDGVRKPGAASWWFFKQGASFFWEQPSDACLLWARKLVLFFHGAEIPRDTDIYAARQESVLLRWLVVRGPPALPDGVLVPLALVGMLARRREGRRLLLPYGFVLCQALVVASFFVTARYRVPSLPVLSMFAAAGVMHAVAAVRARQGARLGVCGALAVALGVLLNLPVREAKVSYAAEREFYRGLYSMRYRRAPEQAIAHFERAAAQDPTDARIWAELGLALEKARRGREAADAWRRGASADPSDGAMARQAADALAREGDVAGAIVVLEAHVLAGVGDSARYAPDHLQLAMLRARSGDTDGARRDLVAAQSADPGYFRGALASFTREALQREEIADSGFWLALGDLNRERGDLDLARSAWTRGLNRAGSGPEGDVLRGRLGEPGSFLSSD